MVKAWDLGQTDLGFNYGPEQVIYLLLSQFLNLLDEHNIAEYFED